MTQAIGRCVYCEGTIVDLLGSDRVVCLWCEDAPRRARVVDQAIREREGLPKRVIIESPYAGDVARNVEYARACLLDSLLRGEAPLASHLLYTQVLDDAKAEERARGIAAGLIWAPAADLVAVYTDLGLSSGMRLGIDVHAKAGRIVELRNLGGKWSAYG